MLLVVLMILFSYLTVAIVKHLRFWVAVVLVFTLIYTTYKVMILYNIPISEVIELYYTTCKEIIRKCIDAFVILSQA